jgi:hypothetical protein
VEPDESPDIAVEKGLFQRSVAPVSHPPQSSSASRFTAAQAGFFLSQSGERPERYGEPLRFDTMPSRPSCRRGRRPSGRRSLAKLIRPDQVLFLAACTTSTVGTLVIFFEAQACRPASTVG